MKKHLSRQFLDESLLEWEAYVSAGQPDTDSTARIYFVCLNDAFKRPRWTNQESRDVAEAHRTLAGLTDEQLIVMLQEAEPLE